MKRFRHSLLLLLTCSLWLGMTVCSFARGFEPASSLVHTDGTRFAVFVTGTGALHVADDRGGREYDVKIPDTCAPPVRLIAAGGGQALVNCDYTNQDVYGGTPLLLDLDARSWHEPVGAVDYLERLTDGGASFSQVGAHWLLGTESSEHSYVRILLDWRTGEIVTDEDASVMPDPDKTDPSVPLCHPLRRPPTPGYPDSSDGPPFVAFPYEAPYALVGRQLRRCGVARGLVLLPRGVEASAQLAAGYVTWSAGGAMFSYQPGCGVLSRRTAEPRLISVSHTGRFIYETLLGDGTVGAPLDVMPVGLARCPSVLDGVGVQSGGARRSAVLVPERSWSPLFEIVPAPRAQPAPLALSAGGIVSLRTDPLVRGLRWRVGAGTWRGAKGGHGEWTFRAPPLGAPMRLTVKLRRGVTAASYALSVRPRR